VQRPKHVGRRRFSGIDLRQLARALDRIAIDQPAFATSHESKWWMLGERETVNQMTWWRVRTETALVIRPECLDLGAEIVLFGDDVRVGVAADDTACRFVRRTRHEPQMCRDGA
jgi:hypothetical protein